MMTRVLLSAFVIVIASAYGFAQVRGPIDLPVEMDVPIAPTPFKTDGKTHLVYELHLTNFSSSELALNRIEVLDAGKPLMQIEGAELIARLARPGLPQSNQEKQRLGGGMRAIFFIWLTIDAGSAVPARLAHRVTASMTLSAGNKSTDAPKPEPIEVKGEGAEIKVGGEAPLVISPPLRGGEWLAANGPANSSSARADSGGREISYSPAIRDRFRSASRRRQDVDRGSIKE